MTLASLSDTPYQPDELIAGHLPLLSVKGTLLEDETVLRGSVLGKITTGEASSAAKTGGNAADTGTFVLDATTPILAGAMPGVYLLRCITAAANGGTFRLYDPDGGVLGDYAITGGAGGTVTVDKHIKGVLTDGTQDFIVGEGFDITVEGSGKYRLATTAAVDGSAVPCGIAVHAADADGDDVDVLVYTRGDFNAAALAFGTGHDADSVREALAAAGIHLVTTQES